MGLRERERERERERVEESKDSTNFSPACLFFSIAAMAMIVRATTMISTIAKVPPIIPAVSGVRVFRWGD